MLSQLFFSQLFSVPDAVGITGLDTPGITPCTIKNSSFHVCNNEIEDEQWPSYATGNGHDVIWEGPTDQNLNSCVTCRFLNWQLA